MIESKERVIAICYNLDKGVAKECFIKGHLVEHLSQGLAVAVYAVDKLAEQWHFAVECKSSTGDIVGLVVDYSAVGGR